MLWFAVVASIPAKLEAAEQWRQQWHWLTQSTAQRKEHSNGSEGGYPREYVDNFQVLLLNGVAYWVDIDAAACLHACLGEEGFSAEERAIIQAGMVPDGHGGPEAGRKISV